MSTQKPGGKDKKTSSESGTGTGISGNDLKITSEDIHEVFFAKKPELFRKFHKFAFGKDDPQPYESYDPYYNMVSTCHKNILQDILNETNYKFENQIQRNLTLLGALYYIKLLREYDTVLHDHDDHAEQNFQKIMQKIEINLALDWQHSLSPRAAAKAAVEAFDSYKIETGVNDKIENALQNAYTKAGFKAKLNDIRSYYPYRDFSQVANLENPKSRAQCLQEGIVAILDEMPEMPKASIKRLDPNPNKPQPK